MAFSIEIPQYSIIFVSSKSKSQLQNFVNLLNDDVEKLCKRVYYYSSDQNNCKELYAPLQSASLSTGSDINDKIKKVSKYGEYLFVICDESYSTLNFNNLKSQNVVFISYDPNMYSTYGINKLNSNILRNLTENTIKAILKNIIHINDIKAQSISILCEKIVGPIESTINQPKDLTNLLTVSIEGNIKNKVSCLSVTNILLNIANHDLNIHSLYMYDSLITSYSENIRTTFLILNPRSLIGDYYYKIQVEQFGYLMFDNYNSVHQIYFYEDQYCVASTNIGFDQKICYVGPKSVGKTFNWIVQGSTFYFYPMSEYIGENIVNISLIDRYPKTSLKEVSPRKNSVYFLPNGNWTNVHEKPTVIITSNNDLYINTYQIENLGFTVKQQFPYSYVPLNKQPFRLKPKYIGIISGIAFIVIISIIFIIIAVLYRPRKEISMEEELSKDIENI